MPSDTPTKPDLPALILPASDTTPTKENPMPPIPSQANTPAWLDKSFWLACLGLILPIINRKFGLGLDATEVLGALAPIAVFIAGTKWKSGHVLAEEIKAKNAITLPAGMTAGQASLLLAQLGLSPDAVAITPAAAPAP